MLEFEATIVDRRPAMQDSFLLTFSCPPGMSSQAKPGQFVNILPHERGVYDPILRRPYSLYAADPDASTLTVLIRPYGRGGQWIIERPIGGTLNVLGLLGNAFVIPPKATHLLMIAGGVGAAPLRMLSQEAAQAGKSVTYLLGARTADQLLDATELPPAVEYVVATEDGSAGSTGFVTGLVPDYLRWADQVFVCGPTPMMVALRSVVLAHRFGKNPPVQVSVERTMACGVGACLGCVVETKRGMLTSCLEGPVYDMDDMVWGV